MASSLLRAVPGILIWDSVRTSLMRASSFVGRNGPRGSARRAGVLRSVGVLHLFHDGVVLGAVHEVADRDVLGARGPVPGPQGQVLVGHDQVIAVVQVGDGHIDHADVGEAGLLQLVAQHRGPHGAGAHAGVTGEHDLADRLDPLGPGLGLVVLQLGQHPRDRALLALEPLHLGGRGAGHGCPKSSKPARRPSARPWASWSANSSGCWTPTWPRWSGWPNSSASGKSWTAAGPRC